MITDFLMANQAFLLAFIATIVVWFIAKWTGSAVDKTKIVALMSMILEIIQDIKTNPKTAGLTDSEKKAFAVDRIGKTLPKKKQALAKKIFGTLGGAVEFVYHNRNALVSAAAAIIKKVF